MNIIKKIKRWFRKRQHPYQFSVHMRDYMEIAEEYHSTPDRVHQLAHGKKPHRGERIILSKLHERGIVSHRRRRFKN